MTTAKWARSACLVAGALAWAACGGGGGDARGGGGEAEKDAGPPQPGGTAVIAVLSDFQAMNPVVNTHTTTDDVLKYMLFTPLIRYDEKLTPQPYLAERWQLSDSSVTFTLRGDVRWHDGRPVTAEDVKFTFDLAKDTTTGSLIGSAYLTMVKSATVVDPRTIRFDFEAPHAQALEDFWWAPVPKHLLEGVSPAELGQHAFNQNPVGSGPFRLPQGGWRPNQSLTLEANPDFPQGLGGRPNLDRVVWRIIPEATTMMTELINGTADVIGYTLLPDQAAQIQQQRGVDLRHNTSREFTFVAWNNTREPFRDAAVRRALTMGIDRGAIIQAMLRGYGQPASGVIPPWSPMYTAQEPLPYDAAQARQILAQAGWRDGNGDGIVEKGGRPLRFVLQVNSANRLHQDMAQVIQQQLKEIGAQVEIRAAEFQSMLREYKARNYDAVIANWTLDTFKVDPTSLFSCAQARVANSANRTGYCNPRADQLMEQGVRTTDAAQAKQVWSQFSQLIQQDQPVTFLYWSEDLAGVGPRLRNVDMDVRAKIVNIHDWWIPANRRR